MDASATVVDLICEDCGVPVVLGADPDDHLPGDPMNGADVVICGACVRAFAQSESRLFPTAAELGCPPVAHGDADLSRIRVTAPATLEEYDRLHAELEAKRAERKAKRDRIEGAVDLAGLGAL